MLKFRMINSPAIGIYNETHCTMTELSDENKRKLEIEIGRSMRESYLHEPPGFRDSYSSYRRNSNVFVVYVELKPFYDSRDERTFKVYTSQLAEEKPTNTNKNKLLLT